MPTDNFASRETRAGASAEPQPVNLRVARLLYELGALTARTDDRSRRFRASAYRRAAEAVANLEDNVFTLPLEELTALPGIGPGTAARIGEIRRTDTIAQLEELRAQDPGGAEELLRVPGLGPRTVARLRDTLGVRDIAGLQAALDAQRVRTVRGLGPATEQRLQEALHQLDLHQAMPRLPIANAVQAATRLARIIRRLEGVVAVEWAGKLRRMSDTVDGIDLVVAASAPQRVRDAAAGMPSVREIISTEPSGITARTFDGPLLRLTVAPPDRLGAASVHATSDPRHWSRLAQIARGRSLRLDPDGLCQDDGSAVATPDDRALYAAIGLPHVPAEQRDGTDELTLAQAGRLPRCADVNDLRGDLHDHTEWSGDGRMTMRELLDGAVSRGWQYIAVTDHAENLRINGLDRHAMRVQRGVITALRREYDTLAVLHGAELNIAADGSVDYDADFVAAYDWTVASVHSRFDLDVAAQTRRVVAAIHNPAVHAIGHLTGRRIGLRPGIQLDIDTVLEACRDTGTALEINCHLDRLDAPAEVLREAASRGVLMVISTDAHRLGDLTHRWGVRLARRGRVPRDLVANTWPAERFLEWAAATG
jgi:DNA polymerase (family 10)